MSRGRSGLAPRTAAWLSFIAVVAAGCGDKGTGPELPALEAVVAGGDGQFGHVGEVLGDPLRVVVRRVDGGKPQKDVTVEWRVVEGVGAELASAPETQTDSTGSATARVRLGTAPGRYVIRATVREQTSASVDFEAFAVEQPDLLAVPTDTVRAGDTIDIQGRAFSPVAEQDVVLFSGIRGRVLVASGSELRVEIPACLPGRTVDVTVGFGSVRSSALPLHLRSGGPARSLEPGEDLDVVDPGGFTCLKLAGGARYLVVPVSASTVGAARHDYTLTGLASPSSGAEQATGRVRAAGAAFTVQDRFEAELRRLETELLRPGVAAGGVPAARTPARVPAVGDRRTFKVRNQEGEFEDVTAVAQVVSERAALYVDETSPAGGYTTADLEAFARRFDDVIHPTVTGVFGAESDLDGNERVVVLLTPAVNRLTPRGATGFVGGFFFGLDLLPDLEGSNGGEIFYTLVPDPAGSFGDVRSKTQLLDVVPAVLAHEFQHMVHFNQRVLVLKAAANEALWLSEALAQMAEELVAEEYERLGDATSVQMFGKGNRDRARRFLVDPSAVSLIVATGIGTLEERGAGWLYLMYLRGRFGGNEVLTDLTRTTRTGIDNVTAVTGDGWGALLGNWAGALFLDGQGTPVPDRLTVQGIDLRHEIRDATNRFPLKPPTLGLNDFARSETLWSGSAAYYIVLPPQDGSVSLRLGGPGGGGSTPQAALRMKLVRIL